MNTTAKKILTWGMRGALCAATVFVFYNWYQWETQTAYPARQLTFAKDVQQAVQKTYYDATKDEREWESRQQREQERERHLASLPRVPVSNIFSMYQDNEIVAESRLFGREIVVLGDISRIWESGIHQTSVALTSGGLKRLIIRLDLAGSIAALKYRAGQYVAIKCTIGKATVGAIYASNGSFIEK